MNANAVQFSAAVVVVGGMMFPGVAENGADFLREQNVKTSISNFQSIDDFKWSELQVFDTVSGKPGFVIARAQQATGYGHAEILDSDDFIFYE